MATRSPHHLEPFQRCSRRSRASFAGLRRLTEEYGILLIFD